MVGEDRLVEHTRHPPTDDTIKAIVLRIDSPGGSAVASDLVWRELMLTRGRKPIVASMSDLAASGGYYIAIPAHAIVAQPGTLTGSIGILGGKFVTAGLFEKMGARIDNVKQGRRADMQSPVRRYTRDERARMEAQLQAFYDQFVEKVAEARRSTPEEIDGIAQGRVWTGRQAQELGLVDELGGLERAIAIARQRARIPADAEVQLVIYPPRRTLYQLVSPFGGTWSGPGSLWPLLSDADREAMTQVTQPLRLFRPGEPLALMPYVFVR
jgi:protease IV